MLNIFKFEFNKIFISTLIWGLSIAILMISSLALFGQMIEQGMLDQLNAMMQNPMIKSMVEAFGMDVSQLGDILGFYATRNSFVTMLIGSIYSTLIAARLLSKEESDGTAEFLMSRPVSRAGVFAGKFAAYQANLFILNLGVSLIGFAGLEIFKLEPYDRGAYLILCLYTWFLTLSIGAIGLFISMLFKRGRVSVGAPIGVAVGAYFVDMMSRIDKSTEFVGYISPFFYTDSKVLDPDYSIDPLNATVLLGLTIILTGASYIIFRKKDFFV